MDELKPGMIVVEESLNATLFGKLIRWATKSNWTHCFIVTGPDEGIEAVIPKTRTLSLSTRFHELRARGATWWVLDHPEFTDAERAGIVTAAQSYLGRRYDYLQCVLYGLFGRFIEDGERRMVCSRTCTASHLDGAQRAMFDPKTLIAKGVKAGSKRFNNLLLGWATPKDIAEVSNLVDITDIVVIP